MPRVAIVIEPEPQLRRVLLAYLTAHGYQCLDASTLAQGVPLALAGAPTIVVLNVGAPGAEPSDAVKRIRCETRARILLVGDHEQAPELARCLEQGADDFVTQPFTVQALGQRLGAVLGADATPPAAIRIGPLSVDLERRSVVIGARAVSLTELEYRLLAVLLRRRGQVVTIRRIEESLWSDATGARADEVRRIMRSLREKLESDPARPRLLRTETGIGYRALTGAAEPR